MQPDEMARPIYSGWLVPWIRYCVSLPSEYRYSPRAPIGFCGPPVTKAGADTGANQIDPIATRGDKLDVAVSRGDKLVALTPSAAASNVHISLFDRRSSL